MDISGLKAVKVIDRLGLCFDESAILQYVGRIEGASGNGIWTPFPEGTQGFLYFFKPPYAPAHVGQVRFRITKSADPASFASGQDLHDPEIKLPFHWPLGTIVANSGQQFLTSILLRDGLVTEEDLKQAEKLLSGKRNRYHRVVYAYQQPFYVNFGAKRLKFHVVGNLNGQSVVEEAELHGPGTNADRYGYYPFSGAYSITLRIITPAEGFHRFGDLLL